MSIYVQHGWGKSDKILRGIADNTIAGVIWGPRDEEPDALPQAIQQHRAANPSVTMLADPQFYATTIVNPRAGKLPRYPYYPSVLLTRAAFNNPQNMELFARETLDYQLTLHVDRLVSPTVCFDDFQDQWSQIALMMANAAINYHATKPQAPPLLVSFVISDTALSSPSGLDSFLDDVSILEAHGIYLIIRRNTQQYPSTLEPSRFENLLYLVYVLADINQFEVICGYSDFESILLHAVGAKAVGCGWYSNLRQFSLERFSPVSGGQQPRARYSSLPLLNSILIDELDSIHSIGQLSPLLSGSPYDHVFGATQTPSNVDWPADVSTLHHWCVLRQAVAAVESGPLNQRVNACNTMLGQAEAIYSQLIQSGIAFETASSDRNLRHWRSALTGFRRRVGI